MLCGAKEERTRHADVLEWLANDSGSQGSEIGFDVREFGHAVRLPGCMGEMQGGEGRVVSLKVLSKSHRFGCPYIDETPENRRKNTKSWTPAGPWNWV